MDNRNCQVLAHEITDPSRAGFHRVNRDVPASESHDLEGFLLLDWVESGQGHWPSSADQSRSGAGGIEFAIPRKWVSKIAPITRTAVGCNRPHWIIIEGASGRSRCA